MVQIEPIEIFGNNAVLFKAYRSMYNDCKWRVEMLDDVDGILFTSWITAKTIEDVAQKLSLKILNK